MAFTPPRCSCGDAHPNHITASATLADGTRVVLLHGGALVGRTGHALPGVPVARPQTREAWERDLRAGSLALGEAPLYDLAELPALYRAARDAVAQNGVGALPGDVRAAHAAAAQRAERPALKLAWQTYEADAYGRPTVRVAVLDRMRWPGLAVWHEKGRYELMGFVQPDARARGAGNRQPEVLTRTGFSFRTLRELADHLFTVQGTAVAKRTAARQAARA